MEPKFSKQSKTESIASSSVKKPIFETREGAHDTENRKYLLSTASISPESQCQRILEQLKGLFDSRHAFIRDYLVSTVKNMNRDQVLLTMNEDPSLQEYLGERIREIITDVLQAERELQVHNLMQELAIYRATKMDTEAEIKMLKEKVVELEGQERDIALNRAEERELLRKREEEINEMRIEISGMADLSRSIENALNQKEKEQRELTSHYEKQIEALQKETAELKRQLELAYEENGELLRGQSNFDARVSDMLRSNKEQEKNIDILYSKIQNQENTIIQYEHSLSEQMQQERRHEVEIKNLSLQIIDLKEKNTKLQNDINYSEAKIVDQAEKYKELLEAEKDRYMEAISTLNDKVFQYKAEIQKQNNLVNSLEDQRRTSEESVRKHELELRNIQMEMGEINRKADERVAQAQEEYRLTIEKLQEAAAQNEAEMDSHYRAKMEVIEENFRNSLEHKVEALKQELHLEMHKEKTLYEDKLQQREEDLAEYEEEWIPIKRHEEIVNSELEVLESAYQERIASLHAEATARVELRLRDEIENLRKEKQKTELYAQDLESLNEQLRTQINKRSISLMSSVQFSPRSQA